MRGTISAIAPDGTYGQIVTPDGQRLSYWTNEIRNGPAHVGQTVEFKFQDEQPIDIFIVPQPAARRPPPPMGAPAPHMVGAGQAVAYAPAVSAAALSDIPKDKNYWITLLTSPRGRISRKQFWLHGVVPIMIASVVLGWIPFVGQLIGLALLWSSIVIAFKRFHDLGYPGWWSLLYLVPMLVAAVVFGLSFTLDSEWPARVAELLWLVGGVMMLAQLFFVYVRVGQQGPNQYGPDPLEAVA